MKCNLCPAEAAVESLRPLKPDEPFGCGLQTEWLCVGCAREKIGLPREEPPEPEKKSKKRGRGLTNPTEANK